MPRRPCLEPECPNPAAWRGRCQAHNRQRERNTDRAGAQIYNTKRWQITRRTFLFNHPLCEDCGAVATDADHIHGIQNSNPYAMDGLRALCHRCHSRRTRAAQLT